jgi:hypothetical protein
VRVAIGPILSSVYYDPAVRMFAVASVLFLALAGSGSAAVFLFRMPSSNIGCAYSSEPGTSGGPTLRCDILSGLKPKPKRPPGCNLDWTFGYQMHATGKSLRVCAGDTTVDPRSKVVRYGHRWRAGGLTCLSRRIGLRCTNRSGHGFFLSRTHSFRF